MTIVGKIIFGTAFALTAWFGTPGPGAPPAKGSCIPAEQCCKVCDAGQACGDSCISRKKTCHKGRGCACNAAEICATQ